MALDQGTTFADRFTILSSAGSGGTATVYKAYDNESEKVVALKVYLTEGRDPDIVSEFWHREVTSLSKLRHAAIIDFIGAGRDTASQQKFVVLEWVDGITLEAYLLEKGPLAWDAFMQAAGEPILSALLHAADHSITHRDLSPGNILVLPSGQIKIIDFGQAKISRNIVGRTVAAWHTVPYCPPEEDSGTYTFTRDPFAFGAIAVRALRGRRIDDHDTLYSEFGNVVLPAPLQAVLTRALHRSPGERFGNIIEFSDALRAAVTSGESEERPELTIPIRLLPALIERVVVGALDEEIASPIDAVLTELNDVVSVSQVEQPTGSETRVQLETQSYRLIVDIDALNSDHLVIVGLVPKRFRLDSLYQSERWIPRARFTKVLPQRLEHRRASVRAMQSFYEGFEAFQAALPKQERQSGSSAVLAWGRLLDALRHVARTSEPPLRYTRLDAQGSWLFATVDNPDDAAEEQVRTISVEGKWVFRGTIDTIRGNVCTLVTNRPRIDLEAVPGQGTLEIDWQQSKVALDRQAKAVERFKSGELPNPELGELITGISIGLTEPSFANVQRFFDPKLDEPKKAIVSRCASGIDLLVTHGPPGTGKTKLIVELVRQSLAQQPDAKILLVSQTHVALDNALEQLLKVDPHLPCVRIGSGSKESDPRVASCSVDARGLALKRHVEVSSQAFIEARAAKLGVDRSQVELGLRALDVLGLRDVQKALEAQQALVEGELSKLTSGSTGADDQQGSTSERSDHRLRQKVLNDDLSRVEAQIFSVKSELTAALERLSRLGKDGRELVACSEEDLREWADLMMHGDDERAIGQLMRLAEEWRLRFGISDDFKTAIISSASIVAGTCVGFCREDAASRETFDLCIVDEAGKATTTELLVPLAQSRRALVVGDHHQLPAVIDHALQDVELCDRFGVQARQLEVQLFEELTLGLGAAGKAALTTQYRMRGAIGALISSCFYDGILHTDDATLRREAIDLGFAGLKKAVTWLDPYVGANEGKNEQRVGTSFASDCEVRCIVALLGRIKFVFERALGEGPWPTIGVITGYALQVSKLRAAIRSDASLDALAVDCASVHSFQGREVDICIYSVARRNPRLQVGMLKEWRHLNVALSRARDYLVIVGSLGFCRNANHPNPFASIIDFIEASDECDVRRWSDD